MINSKLFFLSVCSVYSHEAKPWRCQNSGEIPIYETSKGKKGVEILITASMIIIFSGDRIFNTEKSEIIRKKRLIALKNKTLYFKWRNFISSNWSRHNNK